MHAWCGGCGGWRIRASVHVGMGSGVGWNKGVYRCGGWSTGGICATIIMCTQYKNYFPTPVTMQPYIILQAKSFVCCRCIKSQCSTCTCVADIDLCASDLHFCGKHSGCVYTGECGCSYWGSTR